MTQLIFRQPLARPGLVPVSGTAVTMDLEAQEIRGGGSTWSFTVPAVLRRSLLSGLDDLGLALSERDAVLAWEASDRVARPWAGASA